MVSTIESWNNGLEQSASVSQNDNKMDGWRSYQLEDCTTIRSHWPRLSVPTSNLLERKITLKLPYFRPCTVEPSSSIHQKSPFSICCKSTSNSTSTTRYVSTWNGSYTVRSCDHVSLTVLGYVTHYYCSTSVWHYTIILSIWNRFNR